MTRKALQYLILSFFLTIILNVQPIMAQTTDSGWIDRAQEGGLNAIGTTAYEQSGAPRPLALIVVSVIKVFLGVLGIIFLILIITAGFRWMTAGGNEENIKKASAQIRNACIGLLIILASYAITIFVGNQVIKAINS